MNKKERHEVPSYTGIVPLHVLADWNCMRRALIACIHGNLIALETVLKDIALEGVDEIGCLGDMVGFGPDIIECVDLVREKCAWSLGGDHDIKLFEPISPDASHRLQKVRQREIAMLKPQNNSDAQILERWAWLQSLQPKKADRNTLFVHGSPRDPQHEFLLEDDFLIFNNAQNIKACEVFNFSESVCFCAHTGQPGMVYKGDEWIRPNGLENWRGQIDPSPKVIVNVGSVGQPRDHDIRSCYVIWDDVQRHVTFHRIPYDIEAAIKRFQRVPELDKRFADRLKIGV